MSLTTDAAPDVAHDVEDADRHDHPSDLLYVKVAAILAVLTALEVGTYFIEEASTQLLVVILLPDDDHQVRHRDRATSCT